MLNYIFLIHGLVEAGFALALIFLPDHIPFLTFADKYALFVAQSFGAALLGSAITGFFSYSLPNMLPCKRVAAIGFMVYHALFALLCFQSRMEGPLTPTYAWMLTVIHLAILFWFYSWFKVTGDQVSQFIKQSKREQKDSRSTTR